MFGYIKPLEGDLQVKEFELYKAVYCGLCRTERKYTGRLSALALSYDFVFLYLLRAELTGTVTHFETRKRRLFHRNLHNVALPNDQLIFSAASSALLFYYKLLDDRRDEGFFKRLRATVLLPYAKHALKKAKKHTALPENEVKEAFEALAKAEKDPTAMPEQLAEISAEMLSSLVSFGISDPLIRLAGEKTAKEVGVWLYLADAADDYESDWKRRRFNPFGDRPPQKEDLLAALDCHCEQAELMLRRLPVFDSGYRNILLNILSQGLHESIFSALNSSGKRKEFS